jgi:hypothetical protein
MKFKISAVLLLGFVGFAHAQEARLSPQQMHDLAQQAFDAGAVDAAADITQALLQRDAGDARALAMASRLARISGDLPQARKLARRAWTNAQTEIQKFHAATARAQALASGGNRSVAQIWLRRAAQNAPSAGHYAVARDEFRYVRARNRLSLGLQMAVAPVSNINNGSKNEIGQFELSVLGQSLGVVDADLSGTGRALSGTEYSFGINGKYRLAQGKSGQQTELHFSTLSRRYTLSEEAKDLAPSAKGSDYSYDEFDLRLVQRGYSLGQRKLPFQLGLTAGKTFYAGDPYRHYIGWDLAQSWALERQALRLNFGARQERSEISDVLDSTSRHLGLAWIMPLSAQKHRLTLAANHRRSTSDANVLDYTENGLQAHLQLGKPVWSLGLHASAGVSQRHYDRGPIRGRDRTDTTHRVALTAQLNKAELYGFIPTVTLSARQTLSDYDQYDVEEFGLRLGLKSAF